MDSDRAAATVPLMHKDAVLTERPETRQLILPSIQRALNANQHGDVESDDDGETGVPNLIASVSYTHLTLPTIYSV